MGRVEPSEGSLLDRRWYGRRRDRRRAGHLLGLLSRLIQTPRPRARPGCAVPFRLSVRTAAAVGAPLRLVGAERLLHRINEAFANGFRAAGAAPRRSPAPAVARTIRSAIRPVSPAAAIATLPTTMVAASSAALPMTTAVAAPVTSAIASAVSAITSLRESVRIDDCHEARIETERLQRKCGSENERREGATDTVTNLHEGSLQNEVLNQ
jgi:hypothetical protein